MLARQERRLEPAACRHSCSASSIVVLLNNYFTVDFVCVEMVTSSAKIHCLLDFTIFDSHVG